MYSPTPLPEGKKKGEHVYCAKINQRTKSDQEPETRVRNICMDEPSGRAV